MQKSTRGYLYLFGGILLIGYAGVVGLSLGAIFLIGTLGPTSRAATNSLILALFLNGIAALAGTWLYQRGKKILQELAAPPDVPDKKPDA